MPKYQISNEKNTHSQTALTYSETLLNPKPYTNGRTSLLLLLVLCHFFTHFTFDICTGIGQGRTDLSTFLKI